MMASGLFAPIFELPTFEGLLEKLSLSLAKCGVPVGKVIVGVGLGNGLDLLDKLILVQDIEGEVFCWLSFSNIDQLMREEPEQDLSVMAHVLSRSASSRLFCVAVSYAIAAGFGGRIIYDDSHSYFDSGADSLSLPEVELYLENNRAIEQ